MLKKHEVKTIIKDSFLDLDGTLSPPDYKTGKSNVYEVSINEDKEGNLILIFKDGEDTDKYKIAIEYLQK